jgi:hypothetical protein
LKTETTFWRAIDNYQRLELMLHPAKETFSTAAELRKYREWNIDWSILLEFFESARLQAVFSFKGIFPFDKELINEHFLLPALHKSSESNRRVSRGTTPGAPSSKVSKVSRTRLDTDQVGVCHTNSLCIGFQKDNCSEAVAGASHSKMVKKPGQATATAISLAHKCLKCLNSSHNANHSFASCPN